MSATAQALFSGTALGLAGIVGGVLGGYLYDRAGVMNLFRLCGLAATFALLLLLLAPSRTTGEAADSL